MKFVYYNANNKTYRPHITIEGKKKSLGIYASYDEAYKVYYDKKVEIFGVDAVKNLDPPKDVIPINIIKTIRNTDSYIDIHYSKGIDAWEVKIIMKEDVLHVGFYELYKEAADVVKSMKEGGLLEEVLEGNKVKFRKLYPSSVY